MRQFLNSVSILFSVRVLYPVRVLHPVRSAVRIPQSAVRSPPSAVHVLYWPVSDMCLWHCWYMYSPLVSFFPVAYLSCSKSTTVLGRLGGSAMFFKHLVSWKFARVHLQNAGWHSIFTLLRSSANVRHDFFILHVCSLWSVLFRADTSSMHCSDEQKFTRSPKISV